MRTIEEIVEEMLSTDECDEECIIIPKRCAYEILEIHKAERPKGKWLNNTNGTFECSRCGCKHSKSNYCPNCGIDMREVEE